MNLQLKSRWIYWVIALEFTVVGAIYRFPTGDSQLIIDGGARILQGIDPYRSYDFGNFALAGLLFKSISSICGVHLTTALLFTLNVIGILVFTLAFSKISGFPINGIYLFVPLTLSSRSLFADGQITGIILLLVSIPLIINKDLKYYLIISSICLTLAVELKLHMALPFCIAASIIANKKILMACVTSMVGFIHMTIGLIFGFSLDLGWTESVRVRSARSLLPGAEFSIWKGLNNILVAPNFFMGVSFITYLILLTIMASTKKPAASMISLAATTPLCLIYQHPYDWIPIIVCAILSRQSRTWNKVGVILLLVFSSIFKQVIDPNLLFSAVSAALLIVGIKISYPFKLRSIIAKNI